MVCKMFTSKDPAQIASNLCLNANSSSRYMASKGLSGFRRPNSEALARIGEKL